MAFDLFTTIHNMLHFRQNQLGHSSLGQALVNVQNGIVAPLAEGVVAQATGGIVAAPAPGPASDGSHVTVPALLAITAALTGPHTAASVPAPSAPSTADLLSMIASLQAEVASRAASPPTMAAPPAGPGIPQL